MDRARYMGRSHACLARLSASARALGAGDAMHASLVAQQQDWVLELGLALSRMSNVKEYRTPQGVRSFARLYIGLMVPIFFGPYWGWVRQQTNFGFAFFFSVIVRRGPGWRTWLGGRGGGRCPGRRRRGERPRTAARCGAERSPGVHGCRLARSPSPPCRSRLASWRC